MQVMTGGPTPGQAQDNYYVQLLYVSVRINHAHKRTLTTTCNGMIPNTTAHVVLGNVARCGSTL